MHSNGQMAQMLERICVIMAVTLHMIPDNEYIHVHILQTYISCIQQDFIYINSFSLNFSTFFKIVHVFHWPLFQFHRPFVFVELNLICSYLKREDFYEERKMHVCNILDNFLLLDNNVLIYVTSFYNESFTF